LEIPFELYFNAAFFLVEKKSTKSTNSHLQCQGGAQGNWTAPWFFGPTKSLLIGWLIGTICNNKKKKHPATCADEQ